MLRLKAPFKFLLLFSLSSLTLSAHTYAAQKPGGALNEPSTVSPLNNVNLLVNSGALELAVQAIDRHQKDASGNDWETWERLRYRLYFQQQQLQVLIQRFDTNATGRSPHFITWATEQVANASLLQGNGKDARIYLRRLIWSGSGKHKEVSRWRQMVIESYLADDLADDADRALIRYQADYPGRSTSLQVLRGKVLIKKGQHQDAFDVLTGVQALDARLLRLFSALEANIYQPAIVIKSAQRITKLKYATRMQQVKSWVLVSRAAQKNKNNPLRISALEQALLIRSEGQSPETEFRITSDDLWQAYIEYAESLGNRKRLLVGDDSTWIKQAESMEKNRPQEARAVYAFLSLNSQVGIIREITHKRLTDMLYKDDLGQVAVALYARGTKAGAMESLPDSVRYRLAIEVLRGGDIRLAASLMKTLKQPPAEESVHGWKLRRARTQIYAGQFGEAAILLQEIVADDGLLKEEFMRRYIQVVFDLQAVNEHTSALSLFSALYQKTKSSDLRRELLFWMAESKHALGQDQEAAEFYLRSAYYGQPNGGDMWGQSARYHAAESLARSGYLEDARTVYERLLRHTPDAKRRAIIERNLQQLWLQKTANHGQ